MPYYDYKCPTCEAVREVSHSIKEDPDIICDCSGTTMARIPSNTTFKLQGKDWPGKTIGQIEAFDNRKHRQRK